MLHRTSIFHRYRDWNLNILYHSICRVIDPILFRHNLHPYSVHQHANHWRVALTYPTPKPNHLLGLYHGSNPEVFTMFICKKSHKRGNHDGIVITTNGSYSKLLLTQTFHNIVYCFLVCNILFISPHFPFRGI